ncbi:MAG TPA: YwiC-like family protein [Vicinamibacterales bacterium]|nr:YwiC-like family protein [Vicinamibacterales bacterium]
MSLLPREHGAYGQMAVPLVTSIAVAGLNTASLLIGLAEVAGFLAHEPLLVLLGRRGVRARREEGAHAAWWFGASAATMAAAGAGALWLVPPGVRWSLLLPILPALVLGAAVSAKEEKSTRGELAAALAFSLAAVPLCMAAGATVSTALAVGITFASVFVADTLAVRSIVLAVRGGGDPRAARSARIAALVVAAAAAVALAGAGLRALLPWGAFGAAAPGLAVAVWLAFSPPRPSQLRKVGWALVAASVAAALVLIAGLRR